jgi:hypothetical protein
MTSFRERRYEVLTLAARQAKGLAYAESGLWFHHDLRDNFYYAAHLYEAIACGEIVEFQNNSADISKACEMLIQVLQLQNRNVNSVTYGHWPLFVEQDPAKSKPNTLPVELMGCLIAFFYDKHEATLPEPLRFELLESLRHVYESKLYSSGLKDFNHHEAKLTSLKLLLAERFEDSALLQEGLEQAASLLRHVQSYGMREYGSLPWFWHWVQSITCVRETTQHKAVKQTAAELLDFLWKERALFYMKGAWAGPHSRVLPHDVPRDCYNLHDYIQFGDFHTPTSISRLEGSALFSYEVNGSVQNLAVNRDEPLEVKKRIPASYTDKKPVSSLHGYTYLTKDYALGGIHEYVEEYLNEQHRWDVTWPLEAVSEQGANQLFFFQPGEGYVEGDNRHPSPFAEILLHRNVLCALFTRSFEENGTLIGCLPLGHWQFDEYSGYGEVGDTFVCFHLMHPFTTAVKEDRISVESTFKQAMAQLLKL